MDLSPSSVTTAGAGTPEPVLGARARIHWATAAARCLGTRCRVPGREVTERGSGEGSQEGKKEPEPEPEPGPGPRPQPLRLPAEAAM